METKRAKFERLAETRVTVATKKIALIGNLSSRNNYDYTEAHVKQIFDSLDDALKLARRRFEEQSSPNASGFKFKKIPKDVSQKNQ